jgi:hypothetical protein
MPTQSAFFSGLNDNPTSTDPENPGGIVQSYGFSVVSQGFKGAVPGPGESCGPGNQPRPGDPSV